VKPRGWLAVAVATGVVGFALGAWIGPPGSSGSSSTGSINTVLPGNPEPTSGPYVVVAIDNHFHDIHPEDHNVIHADQPFVVKNEGRNLHNFTVIGTTISVDLRPGQSFTWDRIGTRLKPATWVVVCKYHAYLGMIGTFTVVP
jgi:hypothetical protein